jgi:ubiquinone/menaquinone biosynthesis C-methylase UbiE
VALSITGNLSLRILRTLDRVFPPNPQAFMAPQEQTQYEVGKASETMGDYLAELGSQTGDLDVLDFGCGWGGETLWLAERTRSVCGVDIDPDAVLHAKKVCTESGINNCRFEWSQDGHLPFPDRSFDAVFSTNTFEHVNNLDQAFNEILRVLRPGGRC